MKKETLRTNLLIHLFALAHGLVVVLFYQLGWTDEIALTCLTILMIMLVTRTYRFPLDLSAVMALLFCFAGFFMGTHGARLLRPLAESVSPVLANVICTVGITEVIGWATWFIASRKRVEN
ncbi:MAG: hypothetical protein IJV55_00525 [Paludibacteraceae bacterium]|nr:hypothetical protein [Paludibacteraceae bacterium]MBQ9704665.1 hypothetical protein [Paludibacteraceae bacterium]